MGKCLGKYVKEPIAQPPTGVEGVRNYNFQKTCKSNVCKPPQEAFSSTPSNEEHNKDDSLDRRRHVLPLRERNSIAQNRSEDVKHGLPSTSKDWKDVEVNKKDQGFLSYRVTSFCYTVLRAATQKFSSKNLIGQGGFGDVYKGWIYLCTMTAAKPNTGCAVAVKRLRKKGAQGHEEWQNEFRFLSRLNHPNVAKLIGYCGEGEHRILVYEFVANGSLDAHLFKENDTELNWRRRIKIAVGAARGLHYLQTRGRAVIHRDLKASNILLDADFNAKISDFGLAKYGPQGSKSHISTRILGTGGYFAPEYVATGHLTLKTDVYSFGVVLLEILTGCGAIKKYSDGTAGDLAQWAKPHLNEMKMHRIIDKRLHRDCRIEEAQQFANIILRCLNPDPKSRPTMSEVVAALEQLQGNLNNDYSLGMPTNPKAAFLFAISPQERKKLLPVKANFGTFAIPNFYSAPVNIEAARY